MRKIFQASSCIGLWMVIPVLAGAQCGPGGMPTHRGGHHAMHHTVSATAKLTSTDDATKQTITLRLGPVNLPAHADHMAVAQPRDQIFAVPIDGWFIAYHPRMLNAEGAAEPNKLLHHVAFWNTARSDFLCPNKQEHIFGAGGEMNDWPSVGNFGYRVHKGDAIRIETMVANPTDTDYPESYLEVRVEYRRVDAVATPLLSVYPAWIDAKGCRNSAYDLPTGENQLSATATFPASGTLLGVGGHMHDYGERLLLRDVSTGKDVARLEAIRDEAGHVLSMPVVRFEQGYQLRSGGVLEVTSVYDNTSGHMILEGAMGIVVGYFYPFEPAVLQRFERRKSASGSK